MALSDLEPTSISASLASDGKKIEVVGERKIDGCSCHPSIVKEIALPYRPRPEDIDVVVNNNVLSLRLARESKSKESARTPLKVSNNAVEAEKKGAAKEEEDTSAGTQAWRFVPHESARENKVPPLEEQEKMLQDKFRAITSSTKKVEKTENAMPSALDEHDKATEKTSLKEKLWALANAMETDDVSLETQEARLKDRFWAIATSAAAKRRAETAALAA